MISEFKYVPAGLQTELSALDPAALCRHYLTHARNFPLDDTLGAAYFNRFAQEPDLNANPLVLRCFLQLLGRMTGLQPFNPTLAHLRHQATPSPEAQIKVRLLESMPVDPNLLPRVNNFLKREKGQPARLLLLDELAKAPGNILVADMLLDLDLRQGFDAQDWLTRVEVPALFAREWLDHAACMHAWYGRADKALTLWPQTDPATQISETVCNLMAASLLRQGSRSAARALLERSLALDPNQLPIKRLAQELASPFAHDPKALDHQSIAICLYSFNKADLLAMTLDSLRTTELGKAQVFVLANGCSDNSAEVVRAFQRNRPDIPLELIELPVNVGAPAARNWLVHKVLSGTDSQYVAFLDDDVTLPPHWLQALMTAIRAKADIGAVGCKVVNPDGTLQYTYRDVSIAVPGMFRLSLATPINTMDLGLLDVARYADTIMGCCHLMRREALEQVPEFDIRFSPTQLDDVAFHLDLRLAGWSVRYLGQLACTHHRSTGFLNAKAASYGNSMGNDVKFYYRFADKLDIFRDWQEAENKAVLG